MSSGDASMEFLLEEKERVAPLKDKRLVTRVEELFDVRLSVRPAQDPTGEFVSIHGTQNNQARAKKYVQALCCPEFFKEIPCGGSFAQILFGENSRLLDELERESQTCIEPSSSRKGMVIKGCECDVLLAASKLSSLVSTMERGHREDQPPPPHPPSLTPRDGGGDDSLPRLILPPSSTSSSSSSTTSLPPPPHPSTPLSASLDQQLRDAVHRIGEDPSAYERMSAPEKRALLEVLNAPTTHPPLGTRSPQVVDLQQERRVDFFVSLGFPREKVVSVLESLSADANDDKVMARLNSMTPRETRTRVGGAGTGGGRAMMTTPTPVKDPSLLRPIIIDGSNVAMRHGKGGVFSCRGILIAVQWFRRRGHQEIKVFVPSWRKEPSRPETPIVDQDILEKLEREGILHFTPSRRIGQKRIVCYDDRFILNLASERQGVVVSTDQFRDLLDEKAEWREIVERRLLMFTFVDDSFMVPEDPLGRRGPSLADFLQFDAKLVQKGTVPEKPGMKLCPYMERCTFGKRCKFYHPEREREGGAKPPSRSSTPSPSPDSRHQNHEDVKGGGGEGEAANMAEKERELSGRMRAAQLKASPQRSDHTPPPPMDSRPSVHYRPTPTDGNMGFSDAVRPSPYHLSPANPSLVQSAPTMRPGPPVVDSPMATPSSFTYPQLNLRHHPSPRVHTEDLSRRHSAAGGSCSRQEQIFMPPHEPVMSREPTPTHPNLLSRGGGVSYQHIHSHYVNGRGFPIHSSYPQHHPTHHELAPPHSSHEPSTGYLVSRGGPSSYYPPPPPPSLRYQGSCEQPLPPFPSEPYHAQHHPSSGHLPPPHYTPHAPTPSHPHTRHVHSSPVVYEQGAGLDPHGKRDHLRRSNSHSSLNQRLFQQACAVLPGYESVIRDIMQHHPQLSNLDELVERVQQRVL